MNRLVILFWSLVIASTCAAAVRIFNKDEKKNWAVLVAGTNGWAYYRHQADISHAYQLLTKRGIPEENIITFMYDDIARHRFNPYPGKLFNDYSHIDVYQGVVIDYKRKDVTTNMFTRVMKGDAELKAAGKKVLESGPKDNVFVYISTLGSDGLITFPDGELYASTLNETITFMHENERYGQMVFYIDASNSGSMFDQILSPRIKVYATTSANKDEYSYAGFCNDAKLHLCMADEYSYNWMQDTENNHINEWSLYEQYNNVRTITGGSSVKQYGDLSMGSQSVSQYQSYNYVDSAPRMTRNNQTPVVDMSASQHSHITSMMRKLSRAQTKEDHIIAERRLQRASQLSNIVEHMFEDITTHTRVEPPANHAPLSKTDELKCFESVFDAFRTECFSIQQVPEVANLATKFHQLCREGYSSDTLIESIFSVCG